METSTILTRPFTFVGIGVAVDDATSPVTPVSRAPQHQTVPSRTRMHAEYVPIATFTALFPHSPATHAKLLPAAVGGSASCKYVHQLSEVDAAIAAGACDLVALVPPAGMEHVEHIAGNREKMPPKSTYFYPKLLTGLVFNSLKTN